MIQYTHSYQKIQTALICLIALFIFSVFPSAAQETPAETDTETVLLHPGAQWEYTFSEPGSNWNTLTEQGWSVGSAPFGTPAVLNNDFVANTAWPADAADGDDLWIRRTIDLNGIDRETVKWFLGVDNGFTLYVNGILVASGNAEGYTNRWEYSGQVPATTLKLGENIIAVALEDHGGETMFDMKMTGAPDKCGKDFPPNDEDQGFWSGVSELFFGDQKDPDVFSLSGPEDVSNFTLTGNALSTERSIHLTTGLWQSGGVFHTCPVSLEDDASFSTSFQFRIRAPMGSTDSDNIQGADGITFVVTNASDALGSNGGGIGYEGISPSLGVEFDTWKNGGDPDGNHIGINVDGSLKSKVTVPVPTPLNDGRSRQAWVNYDGSNKLLSVTLSDGQTLEYQIDLAARLGTEEIYLGLTSGTGAAGNIHEILRWDFIGTYTPDRFSETEDIGALAPEKPTVRFLILSSDGSIQEASEIEFGETFLIEATYSTAQDLPIKEVTLEWAGASIVVEMTRLSGAQVYRSEPLSLASPAEIDG